MSSVFQAKNIRRHDKLVHQNPPQIHFSAYVTGGLKKLYTKINSHDASVLPLYEYGRFTDINGHFVPEKNSLLASRYRVLGKVSPRIHGQSSVQIFAKDEFNSDSLVVIKVLHRTWGHLAYQEIHFLWSLNVADPHKTSRVVQLINIFELDDHFCLVFEPLVPAPLTRVFQGFNRDQLIPNIKKVALRLLTTLGFLEQQNVIHADLKPENILLKSESDVGSVTVIDFGNAIHNKFKEVALYFKDFELQTLLYRAPEVLFGLPFGTEIDLWSLGCILAELYSGLPLFPGTSKVPVIKEMTRLLGPFPRGVFQKGKFYDDLKGYTDNCEQKNASGVLFKKLGCRDYLFRDFLSGLLRYNPAERFSPLQAAQHPFLASELPIAFLLPADKTVKEINPYPGQVPAMNTTPLDMDQLKSDLLQKVKFIQPPENEEIKPKVNFDDPPVSQTKKKHGISRRYHSLSDIPKQKTNSDSKIQRQLKNSPFHGFTERKSNKCYSPGEGIGTSSTVLHSDKILKSPERSRQRHSRSLDEIRGDESMLSREGYDRESSFSNERRLKSLMQEIHEVQEMVEENMDQGSIDSADSFEIKRRRFSDSHCCSTTQNRIYPGLNKEAVRNSSASNSNMESSLPNLRKFISPSGETFFSNSNFNSECEQTVHDAQPCHLDSRRINSCDARIRADKNATETVYGSKVQPFSKQVSPRMFGLKRKSSASSTCSNSTADHVNVHKSLAESPGGKNLQELGTCFMKHGLSQNAEAMLQSKSKGKIKSLPMRGKGNNFRNFSNNITHSEFDQDTDDEEVHIGRKNKYEDRKLSSPVHKNKGWNDFYKVKQPVEAGYSVHQAKDDDVHLSYKDPHPSRRTGKNEMSLNVDEENPIQNGKKGVSRKRLMFSNALTMKKRKKRDSALSGARKRQLEVVDKRDDVLNSNSKDPFYFPNSKALSSDRNRAQISGHDVASQLSNSHHNLGSTLEKNDRAGSRNSQDSPRMFHPNQLNKRRKFSLDFSPIEKR
uniref:Probable serine/threonine-protein kinase yakA n=1 Tax=Crassostrea virginica TaxID=6565 RepID=A0A8B8DVF5_CRAVI|nr:probable serine/threonine-protein kinase yakA [Crassostrea virginica]